MEIPKNNIHILYVCVCVTAILKKSQPEKKLFLSKGFQSLFTPNTHLHSPTSCWQDEERTFVDKKEYKDT